MSKLTKTFEILVNLVTLICWELPMRRASLLSFAKDFKTLSKRLNFPKSGQVLFYSIKFELHNLALTEIVIVSKKCLKLCIRFIYSDIRNGKIALQHWTRRLLRCYIKFCLSMIWIDFLLRLPSFVRDFSTWTMTADVSVATGIRSTDSLDFKFVMHFLTVVLPELKLVYFPLGTLMLLPGVAERRRNKMASRFVVKFERGNGTEHDSFVVSTSTVAIETLPSLVRIPDRELSCFKIGRRKRLKIQSRSNSEASSLNVKHKERLRQPRVHHLKL